jgi:uncharacterized membrane protein
MMPCQSSQYLYSAGNDEHDLLSAFRAYLGVAVGEEAEKADVLEGLCLIPSLSCAASSCLLFSSLDGLNCCIYVKRTFG